MMMMMMHCVDSTRLPPEYCFWVNNVDGVHHPALVSLSWLYPLRYSYCHHYWLMMMMTRRRKKRGYGGIRHDHGAIVPALDVVIGYDVLVVVVLVVVVVVVAVVVE